MEEVLDGLIRDIKIDNGAITVTTESLDEYDYAFYLVHQNNTEKKFYSKDNTHCFQMAVEPGRYKCIFFYKNNIQKLSRSVVFTVGSNKKLKLSSEEKFRGAQKLFVDRWAYRSFDRWNYKIYEHSTMYDFLESSSFIESIHVLNYNDLPLDIFTNIIDGKPLFIFLNGAVERETLKLPVFSGFGVIPSGSSIVSINDPTLYLSEKLKVSWYAGSKNHQLQEGLLKIIEYLIQTSNTNKVTFVGGSAGGFASLYYSRLIPNSIAVVWNPQTNILKYSEKYVLEYASDAFNCKTIEEANSLLPDYINCDLTNEYSKGRSNHIVYLQNISDWHLNKHCKPFIYNLTEHKVTNSPMSGLLNDFIYLHVDNFGEGHSPPSKQKISSILHLIASNATKDNSSIFRMLSV